MNKLTLTLLMTLYQQKRFGLMTINKFIKKNKSKILKPYIIAELGVNHECSIKIAKRMVVEAKKGGADAVKFQAYKAEKIASKN